VGHETIVAGDDVRTGVTVVFPHEAHPGNRGLPPNELRDDVPLVTPVRMLANRWITGLFQAVVEATEEAILNALLAAETMTGRGRTAHALADDRLLAALERTGWRPPSSET
jgi:D-aminopeptidase